MHRPLALLLAVLIGLVPAGAADRPIDQAAERAALGRELSSALFEGRLDRLIGRFTRAMERRMPAERLAALSEEAARRLGAEVELIEERTDTTDEGFSYTRVGRHERYPGTVTLRWLFDPRGRIDSVTLEPRPEPAPSPHAGRRPTVALTLPFSGEWHVTWGGRSIEQNYHAVNPNQRFAYDFDVRRGGRTHRGKGRRLSDYHAFGLPILAAADGRVVAAVDDLPDNPPSRPDLTRPAGNHVVIDHGGGEYSVYLHLQQGSLEVERGEHVRRGRWIARCGNSGNSAVPHLHFHLQTEPAFGRGLSLPAPFVGYVADGVEVDEGEPQRGQIVLGRGRLSAPPPR